MQIIPPEVDLSQGCLTSYHQAVKSRQYCIQILVVQPGADLFWRNVTQRANSALLHVIGCACQAAGAMARLKALRRKNKSNNSNQHVQHGVACSLKEHTRWIYSHFTWPIIEAWGGQPLAHSPPGHTWLNQISQAGALRGSSSWYVALFLPSPLLFLSFAISLRPSQLLLPSHLALNVPACQRANAGGDQAYETHTDATVHWEAL